MSASVTDSLILPASDYYVEALRAGLDPFQELARFAHERDFATCGIIELELSRGLRDPAIQGRFRTCLATMVWQRIDQTVIERAIQLAWALDRKHLVLPVPVLIVAASALQLGATVLTTDKRFRSIPGLNVVGSLE